MKKFLDNNRGYALAKEAIQWVSIGASILGVWLAASSILFDPACQTPDTKAILEMFQNIFWGFLLLFAGLVIINIYFAFRNGKLRVSQYDFAKLNTELSESKLNNVKVSKLLHNIAHETRDTLCLFDTIDHQIISLSPTDSLNDTLNDFEQSIERRFSSYSTHIISNTKEMFDVLTHDSVSVAIKLFDYDDTVSGTSDKNSLIDNIYARTLKRDASSQRERSSTDTILPAFKISGNSAFKEIFTSNTKSFYFCNDLKGNKDYENLNSYWQKYYNACMVSALAVASTEVVNGNRITYNKAIGAICVDNFIGNFDNNITHDFLAAISDMFAATIFQYWNLKKSIKTLRK